MKIIFKHSYRCPISVTAKEEMDNFLKNNTKEIEYELIDVINNRNGSNEVAEEYGITHESPQIIILNKDNKVLWTASHSKIKEKKIKSVVNKQL